LGCRYIAYSSQAALARDVKDELETTLGILSGKGKGVKGKGPRGAERRKMWDEVKALRKEYVDYPIRIRHSLMVCSGIGSEKEALCDPY
jgi:hypothetical protein